MYCPIFGIQRDLRLDMAGKFAIDLLQVGANGLENLREIRRGFFHGVCS